MMRGTQHARSLTTLQYSFTEQTSMLDPLTEHHRPSQKNKLTNTNVSQGFTSGCACIVSL